MIYFKCGSPSTSLTQMDLQLGLVEALAKLGSRKRVMVVPPDFSRFHSRAGNLTRMVFDYYGSALQAVLPALGTHVAMTAYEITRMFPGVPHELFHVHNWRNDVITVGVVPASYVSEITKNRLDFSWPAQLNKMIVQGEYDLILSIGQVVPHEVIGMANYNKNLFVGTGGAEGINKSHFVGAVYGMERLMGRADNPVRKLLNYASDNFIKYLPVVYVHTVIGQDENGALVVRGLFIGDDVSVFLEAADLSLEVNFTMLDKPLKKVVVYLDPEEYKSTWLGNKSIYRTRMAMADDGELIVLAPGLRTFGEDATIDQLIRKYGYTGTDKVLEAVRRQDDLKNNLSAAAHLIHGSSERRFSVTYCPGHISKKDMESVHLGYSSLNDMLKIYDISLAQDGFNVNAQGEVYYYISNPALGLWAYRDRFTQSDE